MWDAGQGGRRRPVGANLKAPQVFYVDGEQTSTEVVHTALHRLGARVTHFEDAKNCLASLRAGECDLLISNAERPGIEGVALLQDAKRLVPSVPVVLLIDHGDIAAAVLAMKGGAINCLERPPEQKHLLSALDAALQASVQRVPPKRVALSPTEEQVLQLILKGQTTAETAQTLHRSRRTIEVHRSHIIRKLEVDGMVDLVRRCAQLGLLGDWP